MTAPRTWAAFAAALTVLHCATTSGVAVAEPRQDAHVVAPWHVSSMDPAQDGYTYQRMQVGETLVDADAEGVLRPGLATSWSASEDGLSWTFALREGVRFHDGSLLTPEAAVASLSRALAQPGMLQRAGVAAIEADAGSVAVRLERPFSALPALLANYTATILAPGSFNDKGEAVAFIGTGPFQVAEYEPPLTLRVTRFDDYWGAPAILAEARYTSAPRAETRAMLAEAGDADLAFTLDPAGMKRLGALDEIKVEARPIPRVITINLNQARPQLADLDARRALSLAIDRRAIAAGILDAPDAAATQLFPPALAGWHDSGLPSLAHDVETAKQLLADLGWTPGEDGVLTRGGERFSLTLRTFPNRPALPLIAAALQDQWRQIGVELEVSVGNSSEIPAGHRDGSLDIGLYARNYGLTPDPIVNAVDDFGAGGGDWGAMNWNAPVVAEALDAALASTDPAVRVAAIKTVTEALQSELPVIPIAWYQQTVGYPVTLEGVVVDPLERSYGLSTLRWTE